MIERGGRHGTASAFDRKRTRCWADSGSGGNISSPRTAARILEMTMRRISVYGGVTPAS